MASNIQNYHNYFPFFPPTPPHTYPSPPQVPRKPPPPPYSSNSPPPTHSTPPPQSPIVIPPLHPLSPPHVIPTPPPSPPHAHHSTVIVVVFVSLGGLMFMFLALLEVAVCCFVKKRGKRTIQETDIVKIDEHVKVQEAIIPGPHGPQVVLLSIEKDEHVEEEIRKNEITSVGNGFHIKSLEHHPDKALETRTISTSSSIQHRPNHKYSY